MITQQEISGLLNQQVFGSGGQKIGEARHVFYDDATGRPEWVTIKTGMLGGGETFVPVRDAVLSEGHLKVPYSKSKIKSAPSVDVDAKGHLSAREELRLYDFYGIDGAAAEQSAAGQVAGRAAGQRAAQPQAAAPQPTAERAQPQPSAEASRPSAAAGTAAGTAGDAMAGAGEEAITLSEEKMHVRVEREESGRARLHKYVETEQREQTIPLRHEEVRLIREPITDADRGDALSGSEISESDHVVTLHAEKPVVETTIEPTERVRLAVEEHTEQQTVHGTVRKEHIRIEDSPDEGGRG